MTEVATTKRCNGCMEVKALSEFHRHAARSDGYQSECRDCRAFRQQSPPMRRSQPAIPAGPVTYRDVAGFTVCNACEHWQRSGARHTCPCACHAE